MALASVQFAHVKANALCVTLMLLLHKRHHLLQCIVFYWLDEVNRSIISLVCCPLTSSCNFWHDYHIMVPFMLCLLAIGTYNFSKEKLELILFNDFVVISYKCWPLGLLKNLNIFTLRKISWATIGFITQLSIILMARIILLKFLSQPDHWYLHIRMHYITHN